jgi:hypothetical protein
VPKEAGDLVKYGLVPFPYMDPTHLRYYTADQLEKLVITINPSSARIEQEQEIDLATLMRESVSVKSRFPVIGMVYQRAFRFLLKRGKYQCPYCNLMAIIDL